ncbi:Adenine nucleotide alpha hydrolases-like superfamily protein [Striga hermonthica]|uniref:Adenine nucleotide alpha hydrolases-like superfamily protein n=1 Tax=Striga hermonthica TaxID=68872 RepID=A0A9N7NIH5_STRHE|nr:Adenine nucleotide alpha hydrolases-like superfamily protein [Striga hermonthica]
MHNPAESNSDHNFYSLEWTLQHFFSPSPENSHFKIVGHDNPLSSTVIGIGGLGSIKVLPIVEVDLCTKKSVVDSDAWNVLCEAVDKHHASVLVVGSHGCGAIKRAVLGSVSDYCVHGLFLFMLNTD